MSAAGMLDDLVVVDLSGITAGGRSTQLLADFGADVIKVESYDRPDTFRNWAAVTGAAEAGDLSSPPFRVVGRNKRAIAVDLRDPAGLEVARRLVEKADIVVENFRRGVLEKLNLGFEQLRRWNPRIVLLSLSSQGSAGPSRNYISYGVTLEALGGLMSMTGYGDGVPVWTTPKVNYPDQIVAILGPTLAVAAVRESRRTGRGAWLDLSQRELVTALLGESVLQSELTGQPAVAPQQELAGDGIVVQAAGDDAWIAVTASGQDMAVLLAYLEAHADAQDKAAAVTTPAAQRAEALLRAWARKQDKFAAMAALQAADIACAAVLTAKDVVEQGAARDDGLYLQVPLPNGDKVESQVGWPFEITPNQGGARIRRRAPHIGEHSSDILRSLGFAEAEIRQLIDSKIVHQPAAN
ncbi:CaiB/BaiF CoA-transferase family protein [Ferrovibrio sp.]|uniref:CaiB/BaiF CoA transferase family protein n=1 Tax=Ferrovibrio sp. TaxID=1917215 RepID=UPI000CAD2D62|nr:CoA transferase [Ferrovibrio sp.]PJI38782.1 MAG: hypothetical protein CTR53_16145 [Ferrovibrio sp.]